MLLYGCEPPSSRTEIFDALPPKNAIDRYMARYFNLQDLVSCSVHGPTFLTEYERFWDNPSSVSIVWVGLLFSMICLAVLTLESAGAEQQSLQIGLYRKKIVQCLLLGEYTKAGPYALEALIHYVYVEFAIRADADKDIWFLLGLEVNLAMRMGYHRDPSHFPDISPLQGEMRRRVWATVLTSDTLISSQMGMPRIISDWKCDTAEPRNLNDSDLNEAIAVLPPSRPETEHTTALGLIARRRLLVALGTVSDITVSVRAGKFAEIMQVDRVLHAAAANIPQPLMAKPMAASLTDAPQIIMARLFLSHLFYKGQVLLHRRFLYVKSPSRERDAFAYSREACLDAALNLLRIQQILDEETCPGGQLHTMRWRVSSILNSQFLSGTMILCSVLHHDQALNRKEEIKTSLRVTRTIWLRHSAMSVEARQAAEAIGIVLAHAEETCGSTGSSTGNTNEIPGGQDVHTGFTSVTGGEGFEVAPNSPQLILQDTEDQLDWKCIRSARRSRMRTDDGLADQLELPAFMGNFTPIDQQGQLHYAFGMNTLENDAALNEWMQMDGQRDGMGWW